MYFYFVGKNTNFLKLKRRFFMLKLEQTNGFSVMNADELFFINGGSTKIVVPDTPRRKSTYWRIS